MAKDKFGEQSAWREFLYDEITKEFDPLPVQPVSAEKREEGLRPWHSESHAARLLGMTKKALERRRARGTGPRFNIEKFGFVIYYDDDLDAWVRSKPKGYKPPPGFLD